MHEINPYHVEQLKEFSVAQLSDALGTGYPVETNIWPVDERYRCCGIAVTALCEPGDNLTVHHALHMAKPGNVLVVAGSSDCELALWGELMSISAQRKGVEATVVDGPIRDPVEIQALRYPVFCRAIYPHRARKERYGAVNVPIQCGGLSLNPGDLILADVHGILAIPANRATEALGLAREVRKREGELKTQIFAGRTIFEVLQLQRHVTQSAEKPPE